MRIKGIASRYIPTQITICANCFHRDVCCDKDYLTENRCPNSLDENLCVVLPCKVGDNIFSFNWSIENQTYEVCAGKAKNVRYDAIDGSVMVSDGERYCVWGKTVFLTRVEAEAALAGKEAQNER